MAPFVDHILNGWEGKWKEGTADTSCPEGMKTPVSDPPAGTKDVSSPSPSSLFCLPTFQMNKTPAGIVLAWN